MTETKTVDELESERRRLSLEAEENKHGAAEDLERVEAELERYRKAEERAVLAEEEKNRRAEEERRHQEEREAKARRRKLKAVAKEHIEESGQIEQTIDILAGLLESHLRRMEEFRALDPELTRHGAPLDMTRYLGGWVAHRLSTVSLVGKVFPRSSDLFALSLRELEAGRLGDLVE